MSVRQVLFAHGPDLVLALFAWEDDTGVCCRAMRQDGSTFDTACHADLAALWRDESVYTTFVPALVPSIDIASMLLGSSVDVLDTVPRGPLKAPTYLRRLDDMAPRPHDAIVN
jgi:hypothetical protein